MLDVPIESVSVPGVNMIWSKLRKRVLSLVVPELRDRIDIHCTTYRKACDLAGEEWITIDGQRVFFGGYCHWHKQLSIEETEGDPGSGSVRDLLLQRPNPRPLRKFKTRKSRGKPHLAFSRDVFEHSDKRIIGLDEPDSSRLRHRR